MKTKSGHLDGVLPSRFTAVYHEKSNKPTVSFRGGSGSEAQFCERVSSRVQRLNHPSG